MGIPRLAKRRSSFQESSSTPSLNPIRTRGRRSSAPEIYSPKPLRLDPPVDFKNPSKPQAHVSSATLVAAKEKQEKLFSQMGVLATSVSQNFQESLQQQLEEEQSAEKLPTVVTNALPERHLGRPQNARGVRQRSAPSNCEQNIVEGERNVFNPPELQTRNVKQRPCSSPTRGTRGASAGSESSSSPSYSSKDEQPQSEIVIPNSISNKWNNDGSNSKRRASLPEVPVFPQPLPKDGIIKNLPRCELDEERKERIRRARRNSLPGEVEFRSRFQRNQDLPRFFFSLRISNFETLK